VKKLSKAIAAMIAVSFLLTACSSSKPEPVPTATKTEAAVVRPNYDTSDKASIPFTINGTGSRDIKINFPTGYKEPSLVTLSSNGAVDVTELNYDGDSVADTVSIDSDEGGSQTVAKYPTADTPARTSNFHVDAKDGVAWAISAQSLGSVQKLSSLSVSGTESQIFMLDSKANVLDFKTIGDGSATVYIIPLKGDSPVSLGGGQDTGNYRTPASSSNANLKNYEGSVFEIVANNPDTQSYQLIFTQQNLDN
jgi:major membrane immunogen (membrane-anchored lipoprotein)